MNCKEAKGKAMAYTHTFEINTTEIGVIQGELDFDDADNGLKITNGADLELTAKDLHLFQDYIIRVFNLGHKCGCITKIEVVRKP